MFDQILASVLLGDAVVVIVSIAAGLMVALVASRGARILLKAFLK